MENFTSHIIEVPSGDSGIFNTWQFEICQELHGLRHGFEEAIAKALEINQ